VRGPHQDALGDGEEEVVTMTNGHRFRFTVLGRYQTQHGGNEMAVTVNLVSGREDHFVHSGTLTMSESEWATFAGALKDSLGDDIEIDDRDRRH
jgi:hypothetical protein